MRTDDPLKNSFSPSPSLPVTEAAGLEQRPPEIDADIDTLPDREIQGPADTPGMEEEVAIAPDGLRADSEPNSLGHVASDAAEGALRDVTELEGITETSFEQQDRGERWQNFAESREVSVSEESDAQDPNAEESVKAADLVRQLELQAGKLRG